MSTTTYVQTGDIIDYVPGGNVSAGDIVVQGELIGQVVSDTLAGQLGALRIEGVIEVPKAAGGAINAGAVAYWDAGNSRATTTASTHKILGKCIATAASAATVVKIKLTPQMLTP